MSRTLSIFSSAFPTELFHPVKLIGSEAVNRLFSYQLILKTPDVDPIDFYKQNKVNLPHANVDVTRWLGHNLTVAIELDGKEISFNEVNKTIRQNFRRQVGEGTRYISGMISSAQYLYDQGRSSYYAVTIKPFLFNSTLKRDYRVFQDVTPIEILDQILGAYPGTVVKRLELDKQNRYPKRDYQCQWNETDFAFFSRICSEWGVNFWFEHDSSGHKLILSDEITGHQAMPSEAYHTVSYYPKGHKITEEYLHEFNLTAQLVSGAFASADYDYIQPTANIQASTYNAKPYPIASEQGVSTQEEQNNGEISSTAAEIFEYAVDVVQPRAGVNQDTNEPFHEQILRNQWQLERLQQQHVTAKAFGYIRGMATGHRFALEHHPSQLANINWTIQSSELLVMDLAEETQRKEDGLSSLLTICDEASSVSFLDDTLSRLDQLLDSTNQQWQIECNMQLIPSTTPIRPSFVDKPRGTLQSALVVGDLGSDSIYTDAHGRIKVQFYWDRYGVKNENSSCWVRVNESWAGNQFGATFIPRLGQEVLVDFINGDPDLPVCVGKVHNADNLPSWQLARNKALSGFRSRELGDGQVGNSAAGRSNHLIFDDTKEHIQTQIKSDHAHSQLSLGDITRVESNDGRKETRGLGFELRTDDWGSVRATKGLYFSTFDRMAASGSIMDAYEAEGLFEQSQQLNETLKNMADQVEAESFAEVGNLKTFVKDVKGNSDDASKSTGFRSEHIIGASNDSIGFAAKRAIYTYSDASTNISSADNLEIAIGNSWLASIKNKLSFVARRGIQLFSSQGKVQIHANQNDIEIIAQKVLNLISASDKINIQAAKEIELTAGGSSLCINSSGISHYTGGKWEVYSASKIMTGPQTKNQLKSLPKGKVDKTRYQLTSLPEGQGVVYANEPYVLYKGKSEVKRGVTDERGNILFKYDEGSSYRVELTDKVEFKIKAPAKTAKEIMLAQGYRAAPNSSAGVDETKSLKKRYDLNRLTGQFEPKDDK